MTVRLSSWLTVLGALACAWTMAASPLGDAIDRMAAPLRFAAVDRHASGKVVIVEMDAASAAAIRRWPWSRTNYAAVVDRLRDAGAASIVFDVDVSSASDAAGDRAFAAALRRAAGMVALPTFGQAAGSTDGRTIDALPIPLLRDHAALASVSIAPDADGQVRSMPFATATDGVPRPSLSAFIAARSGAVDATFPIDMSIDPASIPRLSFVAVRDGRFDPARVRGRDVLIGATAIEMGDRYGTPRWGVIPGVVVQALAAETLIHGVPRFGSPLVPLLLAIGGMMLLATRRTPRALAFVASAVTVGLILVVLAMQYEWLVVYPLAPGLTGLALAATATAARLVAARFAQQRLVDEETGLPNARALVASLDGMPATTLATAQIDNYDGLQTVLGASAATALTIRVAERLALVAEAGAVYRTGNRQFGWRMATAVPIEEALDALRLTMLQPIEVGGRRVDVALSVGLASGSGQDPDRLLGEATMAADEARKADVFWRRSATNLDDLAHAVSLMGELDAAVAGDGIEVHYQPKLDLRTGRIVSVEALVRWRHPARGFIGPDLFIPAAERTNRIAPLTLHVLAQTIRDLAALRATHPDLTAAVNVSARLLSDAMFNANVERVLAAASVPAASLIFEVTESAAMSNPEAAIAALHRYRRLGVGVSLDDYGTGQSTLTYLRQLPLNELKIDRSFVQHAHRDPNDAVLVRSTIALAHELGLRVVAEGVEDEECLRFLAACGCDLAQGYLIGRPALPANALPDCRALIAAVSGDTVIVTDPYRLAN